MKSNQPYYYLLVAVGFALLGVAFLAPNGNISVAEMMLGAALIVVAVWFLLRRRSSEKGTLASLPWIAASSARNLRGSKDADPK
jgi:membrane protein implicated in regulation of membrane protease activity